MNNNFKKNLNFYSLNISNFFCRKKYRIGFIINNPLFPYTKTMASTRIRVYDVIKMFFREDNFAVELYNPLKSYNVVIFQKRFDNNALILAKKLKSKKTKIVLDINVNYYDLDSSFINRQQYKDILNFTNFADAVIVPNEFLRDTIKKYFPKKPITVIEESINNFFFRKKKIFFNLSFPTLIWAGYSVKSSELLLIRDILIDLYKSKNFKIVLITERSPNLIMNEIPIYYEKFNYSKFPDQLLKGDIFIAPRDLSDNYNKAHSFTKIGVAMAVGLPVIASPLPSYFNSPAILCRDKKSWKLELKKMLNNQQFLEQLAEKGIIFVKKHYSEMVIKKKYINLFKSLLEK